MLRKRMALGYGVEELSYLQGFVEGPVCLSFLEALRGRWIPDLHPRL